MRQTDASIMASVSLGADATSTPIFMEQNNMCSIQAVWTGTPVGNFTIETSCDPGTNPPASTGVSNWSTYTGSSQAAGGAADNFTWRITAVPDRWVRLKYTSTSGTGTVNARFCAKGI